MFSAQWWQRLSKRGGGKKLLTSYSFPSLLRSYSNVKTAPTNARFHLLFSVLIYRFRQEQHESSINKRNGAQVLQLIEYRWWLAGWLIDSPCDACTESLIEKFALRFDIVEAFKVAAPTILFLWRFIRGSIARTKPSCVFLLLLEW